MNKRSCPLCKSKNSKILMNFTPDLLAKVNPSYRIDILRDVLEGMQDSLTYSKCKDCGMIYCEKIWDDSILNEIYLNVIDHNISKEKIYSIKKRIGLTRIWLNTLRILNILKQKKLKGLKIIDYGCGWGDFMDVVMGEGINIIGYDTDKIKIKFVQKKGHKIAKSIDELKIFAPVDIFIMNSVLEHLQDVDMTLNLAKEVLKPNGLLIFSVMDYRSGYIKKNIKLLENNNPPLTKNLNPIEHVNIYNYKSVMNTLKRFNFKFFSTGNVLYLTDNYLMRNNPFFIKILNKIEFLFSKIITGKELGIIVYAINIKYVPDEK